MNKLRSIKMHTSPIPITVNKDNYILSKNFITSYPNEANTDRSTNLFINDYRIVGGCVPLDKSRKKILMIRSSNGGSWIIPKGGIEFDELRYRKLETKEIEEIENQKLFLKSFLDPNRLEVESKKKESEVFFNLEKIPGVTYDFNEGALRESWEEAGVKGKINKTLGTYYDIRDPNSYSNFIPWTKRTRGCFPKAIDSYYQMIVDEVCSEWPEKNKRKQKWLELDECVENLLNNGRVAALKAVMKSDLVPDLQEFYLDRYEKDIENFFDEKYKQRAFFRNKFYKTRSATTNLANELLIHVVLNKNKDKVLINKKERNYLPSDYVNIYGTPFVWRCSRFFKKLPHLVVGETKSIKLNSFLGELPCDYDYKQKFDETLFSFDKGSYKFNLTALEFSCDCNDDVLLERVNTTNENDYEWVSLKEWDKMNNIESEYFKKLKYFLVKKSNILGSEKNPIKKETSETEEQTDIDLATELSNLKLDKKE